MIDIELLEKEYSIRDLRFEERYLLQKLIECDKRYADCQRIVWAKNSEMTDIESEQGQILFDLGRVQQLIEITTSNNFV